MNSDNLNSEQFVDVALNESIRYKNLLKSVGSNLEMYTSAFSDIESYPGVKKAYLNMKTIYSELQIIVEAGDESLQDLKKQVINGKVISDEECEKVIDSYFEKTKKLFEQFIVEESNIEIHVKDVSEANLLYVRSKIGDTSIIN